MRELIKFDNGFAVSIIESSSIMSGRRMEVCVGEKEENGEYRMAGSLPISDMYYYETEEERNKIIEIVKSLKREEVLAYRKELLLEQERAKTFIKIKLTLQHCMDCRFSQMDPAGMEFFCTKTDTPKRVCMADEIKAVIPEWCPLRHGESYQ